LDEQAEVTLPATIVEVKPTTTKNNEEMAIVTVEYMHHGCKFAVFPRHWKSHRYLFHEGTCGIMVLQATDRGYHFKNGSRLG
jgi:DNA polymerase III alpha subunit